MQWLNLTISAFYSGLLFYKVKTSKKQLVSCSITCLRKFANIQFSDVIFKHLI